MTPRRLAASCLLAGSLLLGTSANALDSLPGAALKAKEAESLSLLTAEGKILYELDATKRRGYDYCSLANVLAERGEFREAIRAASKALFLGVSEGNDDLVAQAERDLALVYSYAGQLDRAQEYADAALRHRVRDQAAVYGPAYKTLGDIAARRGRGDDAIAYYKRAAAVAPPTFRPLVMVAMANAALAAGDREAARKLLAEAEGGFGKIVANSVARTKAEIELADNRIDEAIRLFQRVADRAGADEPFDRVWGLYGVARAKRNAGDTEGASAAFEQSLQEIDRIRARFLSEEIKTGLFGDLQRVYDDALAQALERRQIEVAWGISERSRGRALLDMVRGRVALASGTTAFAEASTARTRPSDVQAWLKPDEALIEFHVLQTATHVWILRKDALTYRRIELGHDALAEQVEAIRDAAATREANVLKFGEQLYALLVAPIDPVPNERLIVVGHDSLHYLPFQALQTNNKYLIESHAITYAPSANSFIVLRARAESAIGSVLALGNPTVPALVPLPGTEVEVGHIKDVFPDAAVFLGPLATKERLVSDATKARYLHVAAHGHADVVDPIHSTLRLAATSTTSGVFEAYEAYALSLPTTEIVTLSACETGLGKVSRGDEVWDSHAPSWVPARGACSSVSGQSPTLRPKC